MLHREEGQGGQGGKMRLATAGGWAKESTRYSPHHYCGKCAVGGVTFKQQDVETLLLGEEGPLYPKTGDKPCDELMAFLVVAGAGKQKVGLCPSSIQVTVATVPSLRGQEGKTKRPSNMESIVFFGAKGFLTSAQAACPTGLFPQILYGMTFRTYNVYPHQSMW